MIYELYGTSCVDTDACRQMNPFVLGDVTIPVIAQNISSLLINYLACPAVDRVILTYGFHGRRKEVFERVMACLGSAEFRFVPFLLRCEEEENRRRQRADGRDEARIRHGMSVSRGVYLQCPYPRIDLDGLTAQQAALYIMAQAGWSK